MDNIPKFLVSLVLIMLCVIIGVSLVFTNFYIGSARSYHDQVVKSISGSDFAASKIQDCMNDAQSKGYSLSVQPTQDGYIYKVDLTYSISVPVFGTWATKTITGYAIDYAGMAAGTLPSMTTLATPEISLSGDILTITAVENAATYAIYVDGAVVTNISTTSIDLSTLNLSEGTHSITVKAQAGGYVDSAESNAVEYVVTGSGGAGEEYTLSGEWQFIVSPDLSTWTDKSESVSFDYTLSDGTQKTATVMSSDSNPSLYFGGDMVWSEEVWYSSTEGAIVDFGSTPQVVSKEFYDWFTANATQVTEKEYTLSGKWLFNETLVDNWFEGDWEEVVINFTSNGGTYTSMGGEYGELSFWGADDCPSVYYSESLNGEGLDEWLVEAYRTVNLGTTPQVVSKEFYDWFLANATQISDGSCEHSVLEKSYECLDSANHEVTTYCSDCDFTIPVTEENHDDTNSDGYCDHCGWNANTTDIPGLYETGTTTLIASWYKLVNEEVVTADGAAVPNKATQLDGDLYLPDTLTSLPVDAFLDCTELTKIVLADNPMVIYNYAFEGCTSLKSVVLPNSHSVSLREGAFADCTSLESVVGTTGLGFIDTYAFEDCTNLKSITIADGALHIGGFAFRNCTSLESISIPSTVETIAQSAFWGCTSLKSTITISSNLTNIGVNAFAYCPIPEFVVDSNNAQYQSIDGNLYSKAGTTLIQYACGKTNSTFTVPDGVTNINSGAFAGCKALVSVTISDSVTTIGEYAFADCTSLESVVLPDGITTIAKDTFSGCESLTSIEIPDSVTTIEAQAFQYCTSLENINIPEGVTIINHRVFALCSNLKSVVLPSSVTVIDSAAFANCTSLESIVIPHALTSVGYNAFLLCSNLTNVYYTGNETQWNAITFTDTALKNADNIVFNYVP